MPHNTTFFYYFYVHLIVKGIFHLLDLIFFYIVDNNIGYLLRDVCWLIHGYIYYSVYIVYITSWTMLHLYSINLLNWFLFNCKTFNFMFTCIRQRFWKIKIYSNLSHIKLRIPIMHRQFFIKISQNREYIQTFCNDKRNPFHFACHQWYWYNNPQCDMV